MVSFIHEGLIALIRDRPQFAAELMTDVLGIELPTFTDVRLADAKLNTLVPVEYEADAMVVLVKDRPVYGVVVESQLRRDDRKHYTWPLYAVAARARHQCPFAVIVVTPEQAVVEWARQPIDIGDGMMFRPRVIGPDGIPKITDAARAKQDPQLAVLSAIAHGNGDPDTAARIAHVALAATVVLPSDQQVLYSLLVTQALSEAARKVFSMYPSPQEYVERWRKKLLAEGEARAKAAAVLTTLQKRGIPVTNEQRQLLAACTQLDLLDRWFDAAFTASSADDVFAP